MPSQRVGRITRPTAGKLSRAQADWPALQGDLQERPFFPAFCDKAAAGGRANVVETTGQMGR